MRNACLSCALLLLSALVSPSCAAQPVDLGRIRLPSGFTIGIFADKVENARSMTLGEKGTLFVGSRDKGRVYAITYRDGQTGADRVVTMASGLNMPNGVAFHNGALYVAELSRVIRFDGIEERLENPPQPAVVNSSFPDRRAHGWKFIAFGPDGMLYVPIGVPCNICENNDERFGTIMRMKQDGSGMEIFAKGIRNSVGFDWDPVTKELWFTDNGRDWMGDDLPPDELNHAPKKGMNFGFPYCHGGDISDLEFGKRRSCAEFTPPVIKLGPHVAALGMRFYTGRMFPEKYHRRIFIAEHGSWNRSVPVGYRLTTVTLDGQGKAVGYDVFAEGWLDRGGAWGRPVDVLVMPDGALLVSDDKAGVIYRIAYGKP